MSEIPKVYNEYLGVDTYGNILDFYDSPVYNIKLYMIDPSSEQLFAAPGATVVLAQTGVTGTQIDDVTITQKMDTASTIRSSVEFTIKQPGAANFLDQIQLSRAYLGLPFTTDLYLYMEIMFKGYKASIEDEDEGGEISDIAGPYRYKLKVQNIGAEINESGSSYNIKTLIFDFDAYSEVMYKLPYSFSTIGKTLTDHIKTLEKNLNDWHSEKTLNDVPDTVTIDLSQLIGTSTEAGGVGLGAISDESLILSSDMEAEDINRVTDELWQVATEVDLDQELGNAPVYTGTAVEQLFDEDKINHREGASLDQVFLTLLSMNAEFYSKVTRKNDITDVSEKPKTDQAFVSWFRVLSKIDIKKYDKKRGVYAKHYTYTPMLYKTPKHEIALDPKELDVSSDDAANRVREMYASNTLLKAYQYLFTGLNDQVLSFDIKLNPGVAILMAPAGGAIGDPSVEMREQFRAQIPEDEDNSLEGLLNDFTKAKDKLNFDKVGDFLSDLEGFTDNLTDNVLGGLADSTGLGPVELKNILENGNSQNIEQLTGALTKKQINRIATNAGIETSAPTPTEDPVTFVNPASGSNYEPAFSGFAYSADLINPATTTAVDAADLANLGYIPVDTSAMAIKAQTTSHQDTPNAAGAATSTGPKNQMFGFLANQHAAGLSFAGIDIQLRGDPWYLGGAGRSTDQSSPEQMNMQRDVDVFWLQVKSPITYDPDWKDEDSALNSGYWDFQGTSQTFSALYQMQQVKCNFSGGIFTVDVKGQHLGISAANLKKGGAKQSAADELKEKFEAGLTDLADGVVDDVNGDQGLNI